MKQLKKIIARIDGLNIRERVIIFLGAILVIFTAWDSLLINPLEIEQKKLVTELNKKNVERSTLITRIQNGKKVKQQDPDAAKLTRLKQLKLDLDNVQTRLEQSTRHLVNPGEMPKILETLLNRVEGLTLVGLESLGATPLIDISESSASSIVADNERMFKVRTDTNSMDNAWRHGLRIEFQGDYLTTLNYLKDLEGLKWDFYWDNFNLTVNEYPKTNVVFEIFTLSLRQEWISL